jgi:hypothetical protein
MNREAALRNRIGVFEVSWLGRTAIDCRLSRRQPGSPGADGDDPSSSMSPTPVEVTSRLNEVCANNQSRLLNSELVQPYRSGGGLNAA